MGEIAVGEGAALDRIETGMTLAQIGERLFDIGFGNRDFRLVGAQIFVAFRFDLRQHFKGGLETQRFALVQVQVGDPRLRYGMQAQALGLLPEVARDQRLDHIGLDLFGKTLANNRRGNMAAPETGNASHLLIFLDQRFGLAGDVRDWNLNLNLAFGGTVFRIGDGFGRVFFGFSGAHKYLS